MVTELYAYAAFFSVILLYGMETSFFRFYKDKKTNKKSTGTIISSIAITSLLFLITTFLFSNKIATWLNYQEYDVSNVVVYVKIFACILSIDAFNSILFTKLRADERAARFSFVKTINIFFNIFFNIYFLLILGHKDIVYIFYSNLIATVMAFLF